MNEIAARIQNLIVGVFAAVALISLLAFSQRQDEADDQAVRVHVEQQVKAAAQPETWAKLDQQSRQMVAYDQIKK